MLIEDRCVQNQRHLKGIIGPLCIGYLLFRHKIPPFVTNIMVHQFAINTGLNAENVPQTGAN